MTTIPGAPASQPSRHKSTPRKLSLAEVSELESRTGKSTVYLKVAAVAETAAPADMSVTPAGMGEDLAFLANLSTPSASGKATPNLGARYRRSAGQRTSERASECRLVHWRTERGIYRRLVTGTPAGNTARKQPTGVYIGSLRRVLVLLGRPGSTQSLGLDCRSTRVVPPGDYEQ